MTPCHPRPSHVDGTHPARHYSIVYHREHPGREVARFVDEMNHRADADAFVSCSIEKSENMTLREAYDAIRESRDERDRAVGAVLLLAFEGLITQSRAAELLGMSILGIREASRVLVRNDITAHAQVDNQR